MEAPCVARGHVRSGEANRTRARAVEVHLSEQYGDKLVAVGAGVAVKYGKMKNSQDVTQIRACKGRGKGKGGYREVRSSAAGSSTARYAANIVKTAGKRLRARRAMDCAQGAPCNTIRSAEVALDCAQGAPRAQIGSDEEGAGQRKRPRTHTLGVEDDMEVEEGGTGESTHRKHTGPS